MYLSQMDRAISEPHTSSSLAFPPASASIDSSQSGEFADAGSCCERLDFGNVTQNLEVHQKIVAKLYYTVNVTKSSLKP